MSRLVLRCDASHRTGSGHVVRAVALSDEARRRGWDVTVVGSVDVPLARDLLADRGLRVVPYLSELDTEVEVLHLDLYDDEPRAREASAVLSAAADADHGLRPADLLVDPSPTARRVLRPEYLVSGLAIGPRWVPLRREIVDAAAHRHRSRREAGHVLVMMGGTDALGLTETVVSAVLETHAALRVTVIDPTATADSARRVDGGAEVVRLAPRTDLSAMLSQVALVVCGAGTTVWEVAALRAPAAVVKVAENQTDNLELVREQGLAVPWADATVAPLHLDVEHLRRLVASPPAPRDGLVDHLGARRVVDAWEDILRDRRPGPRLRPARALDAGFLFAWRDDPGTRSVSRTTAPLDWSAHVAWLDAAIQDPDRRLSVLLHDGIRVASVRLDRGGRSRTWEISVMTAPDHRGRGHAARAVREALAQLADAEGDTAVDAVLRSDNEASRRLFDAAGFVPRSLDEDGWSVMRREVRG